MSRTFLLNLLAALVIAFACGAGAYFYLLNYTVPEKVVEVPDLTEMDIVEAEAFLKQLHLTDSIIDSVYKPKLAGGMIIKQDPLPGERAKEGRKIYLTLSRYTANLVKMPNVLDQTLPVAREKLKSYGYEIGEQSYKPYICSDCIAAVTWNGKELKPGDKTPEGIRVDLVVGIEEAGELVEVPVLFGLSRDEAKQLLAMNDLNLGASPCPTCATREDSLNSRVIRIDPQPGSKQLPKGTPVTVFLSSDEEAIPEVNLDSLKALLK